MSTIRWISRVSNCNALEENLVAVINTLEGHCERQQIQQRIVGGNALTLIKCVDFEFCFVLVMMSKLLTMCNFVSKNLHCPTLNTAAAAAQVKALIEEIKEKRCDEDFEKYWKKAEALAKKIGVNFEEN